MSRPSRPITQQRPLILFVLSVAMASALVASQAVAWVGVRRGLREGQRVVIRGTAELWGLEFGAGH